MAFRGVCWRAGSQGGSGVSLVESEQSWTGGGHGHRSSEAPGSFPCQSPSAPPSAESLPVLFGAKGGERPQHFVRVELVLLTLKRKITPSLLAFGRGISCRGCALGRAEPKELTPTSPLPGRDVRKAGRQAWKGALELGKVGESSSHNTHAFFQC